ncbi:MAG TPA: hypothetical protein VM324_06240 [Egibacteraceae bacterium]|jgi:hypothetical protein|nr:hypothetical protein [Egibacteraceae bacterium]
MGTDAEGHRFFEGMAVVHVLGGLDESDGRVFRSHLLECSDCRARVGELRALAHDLADVERDEERRRARAAKSLETKRREYSDDDDGEGELPPAPPGGLRSPRLLALVGLVLLIMLAGWNFTLRTTIGDHQARADNVTDASEIMLFGEEVPWTSTLEDLDARIKVDDGKLALLVMNLRSGSDVQYVVYLRGPDDGEVVGVQPLQVTDGRIYYLIPLDADARKLLLTRRRNTGLPDGSVDERTILTAALPVNP